MDTSKVIWSAGQLLRPEHFRQQDSYHEARLHALTRATHALPWGLCAVRWNGDALAHGMLRADALSLVFQDGEPYDAPQRDPLPAPLDLRALAPDQPAFTYHVALPARRDPSVRNRAELLAASAPREGCIDFAVVRVRRLASGGFEIDPDFIPPALTIAAAGQLPERLAHLLQILQAKADTLHGRYSAPRQDVVEVRSSDISSFLLLHTVSAALAALTHYANLPQLHPHQLYERLLDLAGGLMAYARHCRASEVPAYRHEDAGDSFARLLATIRELVDTVISEKYLAIALTEQSPTRHAGKLDSGKIAHDTTFYLAVTADMPALELVAAVPRLFKVGAPDHVEQAVLSALAGVPLVHMARVPGALPVRPDCHYFLLERSSALYRQMLAAQAISIYLPAVIPNARLELMAVFA